MKYLRKINESSGEEYLKDILVDITDELEGIEVKIGEAFLSLDDGSIGSRKSPGFYPGFIISIRSSSILSRDFAKLAEFFTHLSQSFDRIESHFPKCWVKSRSDREQYEIMVIDTGWEKTKWEPIDVARERFRRDMSGIVPHIRFGSMRQVANDESGVLYQYAQPVSIVKSSANVNGVKSDMDQKFPYYDIEVLDGGENKYRTHLKIIFRGIKG